MLTNSVVLVRERTIPTEFPPFVGEVSANFCGYRGVAWLVRRIPYGRNFGFLDWCFMFHKLNICSPENFLLSFQRTFIKLSINFATYIYPQIIAPRLPN
jgi:hypothetical protein